MKALSIGRDLACDFVINDSTDIISRRHAILNISSSGKLTLVDQSRNGTYVNGIRISPNVPVPVSRKDIVSFAHVAKLDWNAVPASNSTMRYMIMGAIGVLIAVCGFFAYQSLGDDNDAGGDNQQRIFITDTTSTNKGKGTETEKRDSTNAGKKPGEKDSIVAPAPKPRPQPTPAPTPAPAPKDTTSQNRPIG